MIIEVKEEHSLPTSATGGKISPLRCGFKLWLRARSHKTLKSYASDPLLPTQYNTVDKNSIHVNAQDYNRWKYAW
jgi:hypothetical protein